MSPVAIVLAGIFLLAALYCGIDPFGHSSMAAFPSFEAHKVDLPSWSEVPEARDPDDRLQHAETRFLNQVQGPESIAFDPLGRGPYTGVADGRILFWNGESWSGFAYTSPYRSKLCDLKPSPLSYLKNEHICGRPLGLRFDKKTGDLYIADAYFGIMKVGPEGGLATPLTTEAEGVRFNFTNDLDIDEEGNIYFTDSSTEYQRRNFIQLCLSGDPSGRLLKFNPVTKETTVLLHDLQFPNGVSLSKDGSFLLFSEGTPNRLSTYWLKGEKTGMAEVFALLPGFPDNIRTNDRGEFWVAFHCRRTWYYHLMALNPRARKFMLKFPVSAKFHYLLNVGGKLHALIVKYGPDGQILQVLEDRQGKVVKAVSEVHERDGKLWIGSAFMPFIAVY